MIARGFKPVAWVAAVGAAALGCYMLSLRVAAERAELSGLERKIVSTKQAIRSLQTELGTRSRMVQLQQWNEEVLALAPPEAGQFLESQMTLARFSVMQPALTGREEVRMASAEVPATTPAPGAAPQPQRAIAGVRPEQPALLRQASLTRTSAATRQTASELPGRVRPQRLAGVADRPVPPSARSAASRSPASPPRPRALLDERTVRDLGTAARDEGRGGARD